MQPDATSKQSVPGFGLVVIGNEVLDGRVQDSHFATAARLLAGRRIPLRYSLLLPDVADIIESHLRWALSRPEPFFCCGGIGTTPDDLTRQCAAAVAGVPLEFHPEGLEILRQRWGSDIPPARLRLVEFPSGAALIPNPFNRVPGFTMRNGHFMPGFPEMAAPMMEWVLDQYYRPGAAVSAVRLLLPGAREGDLVPLMEEFVAAHPNLSFSSLPRFTPDGTEVEIGLSGPPPAVEAGLRRLTATLDLARVPYLPPSPPG